LIDDLKIIELKRRKLLVKDEIARLQNYAIRPSIITAQIVHVLKPQGDARVVAVNDAAAQIGDDMGYPQVARPCHWASLA
jgi:hypothetical protein